MRDPDPFVLYTVVRKSLKMTGGKIGSQCQHAFDYLTRDVMKLLVNPTLSTWEADRMERFNAWRNTEDHAKVVLGATDEEFEQVKKEYPLHFLVIDLGYTQVAPNTETCLGLWPLKKSERSALLQRLKPLP